MEDNQKNILRKRTNEELKIAHINGKYVLIAALITGIFTFFAAVIGNDAGRERANNEAMSQVKNYSIDVTNLEELIDKYNQLSDENHDLKDKNSKLDYNNSNLKEENNSLFSQNETLLAENDSLKNQLTQYSSLEEDYKALVDENNLLNDKIEQLENEQGNINAESPMPTPSPGKKNKYF